MQWTSKYKPSKKGQIYIQTDKQQYNQGDTIKGVVNLNMTQDGFPGNAVFLKFVAWDQLKFTYGSHRRQWSVKNRFINQKFTLHVGQQQQYPLVKFPFPSNKHHSHLKSHLTSDITTLSFQGGHYYFDCIIGFYISAYVNNTTYTKLNEVIKQKIAIIITKQYTPLNKSITNNSAKVHTSIFTEGDQAQVILDIDNTACSLNITDIELVLNCEYDAIFPVEFRKHSLFEYNSVSLGSINRGQQKQINSTIEIGKGDKVKLELSNSNQSPFIKSKYWITVFITFDGCTFRSINYQYIGVPITVTMQPDDVFYAISQNPDVFQIPRQQQLTDWNPTTNQTTYCNASIQEVQEQIKKHSDAAKLYDQSQHKYSIEELVYGKHQMAQMVRRFQ